MSTRKFCPPGSLIGVSDYFQWRRRCPAYRHIAEGALVEAHVAWNGMPGDECRVSLELAPGVTSSVRAIRMNVEGPYAGVHCASKAPDSIAPLRRLVELWIGDPAILDRAFCSRMHRA